MLWRLSQWLVESLLPDQTRHLLSGPNILYISIILCSSSMVTWAELGGGPALPQPQILYVPLHKSGMQQLLEHVKHAGRLTACRARACLYIGALELVQGVSPFPIGPRKTFRLEMD